MRVILCVHFTYRFHCSSCLLVFSLLIGTGRCKRFYKQLFSVSYLFLFTVLLNVIVKHVNDGDFGF